MEKKTNLLIFGLKFIRANLARCDWSNAKKIELIKKVKNYIIKIVGYNIQDLIEVKYDGVSENYNSKI